MYIKIPYSWSHWNVSVVTNENFLLWSYINKGVTISCHLERRKILASEIQDGAVKVHYVSASLWCKSLKLKRETVVFYGDNEECIQLNEKIIKLVGKESHRPKKLLVFINPGCGNQTGVTRYYKVVKPLLDLCGVKAHVVVTNDARHPYQVLSKYVLSDIDVVVAMGGDGTMGLVSSALIRVANPDISLNTDIVTPPVSFATLPAGSGSAFGLHTNGSVDLEESTLSIICGHTVPCDVMTYYDDDQFIVSSILCMGLGLFDSTIHYTDRFRFLGKFRYNFIFPILLWREKTAEFDFEYLPAENNGTEENYIPSGIEDVSEPSRPGWKKFSRSAMQIVVNPWNERDFFYYWRGLFYREPELTSSKFNVRVTKPESIFKILTECIDKKINPFTMSFIDEFATTECRIIIKNNNDIWENVYAEGEKFTLNSGVLHCRLHSSRLNVVAFDPQNISTPQDSTHQQIMSYLTTVYRTVTKYIF